MIRFKRNIVFLAFFLFTMTALSSYGQKQGNIWYFGEYAGLDFNTGAPVAITNSAMFQYDGCATISDKNGQLLFYTNGITVWNKNHQVMSNGTGLLGGYASTQSSVVVQKPLDDDIYYIFTVDAIAGPNGFRYSIVDMSRQSGLGQVMTKNVHLLTPTTEKVTAIKHRNDTNVWVITHGWDSSLFYCYLVTPSGIQTSPVISSVGSRHGGSLSRASGYLKASPNGKKLALAIQNMSGLVEILDFDDSTGVVSNPITISPFVDPYGIEFSPDGTKLYVTSRSVGDIYQFFLEAGTKQDIINSMIRVGRSSGQIGALQVAIDGKIYVARNAKYLGVFNNPNAYGAASNYADNGVYLANRNSKFGLPTFNQSYFYNPEFTVSNFCFGDTTNFSLYNSSLIDSVHWYFGDAGAFMNFSNSFTPRHRYSSAGNYEVGIIIFLQTGKIDSILWSLQIYPKPKADIQINQSPQCLNENMVLFMDKSTISLGTTSSYWEFGDGDTSTLPEPMHRYSYDDTFQVQLIAISDKACKDTAYRNVLILPSPKADFVMEDSAQCFDRNRYEFINTTTINYGLMAFQWDFGDGNTSTQKFPVHTYTTADTFNVILIAVSQHGCPDTIEKKTYVHINPTPYAHFTVNDTFQCLEGNKFSFRNNSNISTGSISFMWSFGDGDTTGIAEPQKVYAKEGKYPLVLTVVSDKGCKDRKRQDIYVNPMPEAAFSTNNPNQCLHGNNVKFNNNTNIAFGKVNYMWDFGDGFTSNQINPEHKFVLHDTFDVEMIVVSEAGCSDTAYGKVFIFPMPLPDFRINNATQCSSGNFFAFIDESSIANGSIVGHSWTTGDGKNYNVPSITHSYTADGTYDVRLTLVSNLGCRDSVTKKVFVFPMPKADFTINNVGQCLDKNFFICRDSSSITQGVIGSLLWEMGDGSNYNTPTAFHNYKNDGIYDIKLMVTSGHGCKDSITKKVIVHPLPDVNFDINKISQCIQGNSFVFTDKTNVKSGFINGRQWSLGDGLISNNLNVTHSYSDFGNYTVKLVAVTNHNCRDSLLRTVSVNPMPKAEFSIDNDKQCLKDNEFHFINSSSISAGSINTNSWSFGDGVTSTIANPSYSYVQDNIFKVKLRVISNALCADSMEKTVVVHPMPNAKIEVTNPCLNGVGLFLDKTTINSPDNLLAWTWFVDGEFVANTQDAQKLFDEAGVFKITLEVVSNNDCRSEAESFVKVNEHVSDISLVRVSVLDDNSVIVEWMEAEKGSVRNYVVERSGDGLTYSLLQKLNSSTFSHIDRTVDASQKSWYYRVYADDSCNYKSAYSNIGKSIHLIINTEEDSPLLSWSPYIEWDEGVDYQEVQLKLGDDSYKVLEVLYDNEAKFVDATTVELSDNYCYRIIAWQKGSDVYSVSNVNCISFPLLIFAPNAFSPNHDGVNDYFEVVGRYITEYEIVIFNRWGEEIFRSKDMDISWDGKYKGEYCPTGVYPFRIRAKGTKGQHNNFSGSIHLLR